MGNGDLTFWNSGVWLIPIILLATLGALYLLVRFWARKTRQDLKDLRSGLRQAQSERRQVDLILEGYTEETREPYGSRLSHLGEQLNDISQTLADLEYQHVSIQERMRRLASNSWQATVGAPFFWFTLRQEVAGLRKKLEQLERDLQAAHESAQELKELPWTVAMQARQVSELHGHSARLLQKLQAKNLRGVAIEQAAQQESEHRSALAKIPKYFFRDEQSGVIQQADLDSVAQTHALLSQNRPELEKLSEQLQAWEKQQAEAAEQVGVVRQLMSRVDQALAEAPPNLNLAALKTQYEQFQVISETLHATLSRLEVESIPELLAEAGKLQKALQEMEAQIQQARQQLVELEKELPVLSESVRALSTQFASLGTASIHPVSWNQSRVMLTTLSRQATAIGQVRKPRTPQQVTQDLESARRLNAQQKELAGRCEKVSLQHAELLRLLSSPDLSQGLLWAQNARQVAARVDLYDPENWPRAESVEDLDQELLTLQERLEHLVNENPGEPVPEGEVAQRLEDTRQLAEAVRHSRERVERIEARLAEVQAGEQLASDQLESTRAALNQLTLLVRSNAFLEEQAANEMKRLQNNQEQLSAELEQRQRGTMERKVKAVSAFATRIEQSAGGWLDKLNKSIDEIRKELGERLAELENITMLDEPSIAEARRLLAAGQSFERSGYGTRPNYRLEEIILELKRSSDFWQSSAAAVWALEDMEQPVLETYQAAQENRQFAREQLADLSAQLRGGRVWPPVSVSLLNERQELGRLDQQWDAIKQQRTKAISLVAQLGDLSGKYRSIAEKAHAMSQRVAKEQEQVANLEADIDDLAQLWDQQRRNYRDNPQAGEEIRALLAGLEQERDLLKRQYHQGARSYDQVLQALQSILRRARLAQVSIDESHVIDINGRVITYR